VARVELPSRLRDKAETGTFPGRPAVRVEMHRVAVGKVAAVNPRAWWRVYRHTDSQRSYSRVPAAPRAQRFLPEGEVGTGPRSARLSEV
jgi:hypothetical protein